MCERVDEHVDLFSFVLRQDIVDEIRIEIPVADKTFQMEMIFFSHEESFSTKLRPKKSWEKTSNL